MKTVTILALTNTGASTVTGPMDVFHLAGILWNYSRGEKLTPFFNVEVVSDDGKPVRCLNRLLIEPHCSINDVKETDLILITSILDIDKTLKYQSEIFPWIKGHYEKGASIASVCTGTFVLAETGLLNGKTATTHWGYVEEFKSRYPQIKLKPDQMITDEGDLFCSGASNGCLDLSLYLVEKYCGHEIAVQCAKSMVIDLGRFSQAPYTSVLNFQKSHNDEMVLLSQKYLEQHHRQQINLEEIASLHHVSRRTFERRFKTATGDTPLVYVQRVRIEAAKRYLESETLSFDEIAYQVGYEDASFFRKIFKKSTSLTPKEYKSRFKKYAIGN
ncbi:helix-turn-helix domain-containing protein [bacterium]|nr:helix-turn-helix domain-containing protein [bacterium]